MKYILMAYGNEGAWPKMTPAEQQQGAAAYVAYGEALTKAGVMVGSNRLQPTSAATTVRITNGKSQVLDGPYVDSKEQLGGYCQTWMRRFRGPRVVRRRVMGWSKFVRSGACRRDGVAAQLDEL